MFNLKKFLSRSNFKKTSNETSKNFRSNLSLWTPPDKTKGENEVSTIFETASNKIHQIQYGLVTTCIIFTIPIIILFYFMLKFRNEAIDFAKNEREGAYKIERIIIELNANRKTRAFISQAYNKIRDIGDYSKLILDPDLDSFYLMTAVIIEMPKIINYTMEFLDPLTSRQKSTLIIPLIKSSLSDLERSVAISEKEDVNYFGIITNLNQNQFSNLKKLFEEEMMSILKSDSNTAIQDLREDPLKNSYEYWLILNNSLIQALNNRITFIENERFWVTTITLTIWLLSILLTLYLLKLITNRHNILEQKNKEKSASLIATSKMSALGEMAGGLAHEVNTPLATIRIRAEQMEELILTPNTRVEDFNKYIESIKSTTERITKIINGLRFFSRQESNDNPTPNSVKTIIEDTLSFCHERFKNHGIELNIIKDEIYESAKIICRPIEISQIFLNLLNNAYDAVCNLDQKWVQIQVCKSSNGLDIIFSDSGPGIPEDIINKVMQPFFTTKEIGKGTGLGLSISVGIIKNHGGELFIDRKASHTKFVIRFPKDKYTV